MGLVALVLVSNARPPAATADGSLVGRRGTPAAYGYAWIDKAASERYYDPIKREPGQWAAIRERFVRDGKMIQGPLPVSLCVTADDRLGGIEIEVTTGRRFWVDSNQINLKR
jgi:hypothetical protein